MRLRVRKRSGKPLGNFVAHRHGAEEARIDQAVHHLRLLRQHVGEARRGTQDHAKQ